MKTTENELFNYVNSDIYSKEDEALLELDNNIIVDTSDYELNLDYYLTVVFNELMKYAMALDITQLLGKDIKICRNKGEYGYSFVKSYKNKPETLLLILEENKYNFLYNVADSDRKPMNISPEEYFDLYKTAVSFVFDKDEGFPRAKSWGLLYDTLDDTLDNMELYFIISDIISNAIDSATKHMNDKSSYHYFIYNKCLSEISNIYSFRDACREMLELFCVDKNIIEDCVDELETCATDFIAFGYGDLFTEDNWPDEDEYKSTFELFSLGTLFHNKLII